MIDSGSAGAARPFDRNRIEAPDLPARAAVGRNETARIEVPSGRDEVAQLAAAFAKILDDLHQERTELLSLSSELERRVAVRTREVERLAEESRYAAIVRERLKIARDLHDTLAHSMMAMLSAGVCACCVSSELHDLAQSLREELSPVPEGVAHEGLNEAANRHVHQMRVNAVRDTGLKARRSASAFSPAFIDRASRPERRIHCGPRRVLSVRRRARRGETLFRAHGRKRCILQQYQSGTPMAT